MRLTMSGLKVSEVCSVDHRKQLSHWKKQWFFRVSEKYDIGRLFLKLKLFLLLTFQLDFFTKVSRRRFLFCGIELRKTKANVVHCIRYLLGEKSHKLGFQRFSDVFKLSFHQNRSVDFLRQGSC